MARAALLAIAWTYICCVPSIDAIAVRRSDSRARDHASASVTPVEKVIELLGELSTKVQEEGTEEAASYDKFACFCKEQADSKMHGISKANAKIEELQALITQLQGEIAQLGLDMKTAQSDVETERNASAVAVDARNSAHASFLTEQAELKQAVDVCQRALDHMLQSQAQVEDSALLQKDSTDVMNAVSHALAKLSHVGNVPRSVSLASTSGAVAAPAPAGAEAAYMPYNGPTYEYSSGVVIDTLRSVKRTFQEQLTELEEGETSEMHSFNMMEGARSNRITALLATISQSQKLIAEKSVEEQEAQKVMDDEITARDADQSFLDQLTTTCQEKASLWDQRSKMRASELTALTQALEMLKSTVETYNVNTKLVGLIAKKQAPQREVPLKKAAPAFVQLSLAQVDRPEWSVKLSKFLQAKAQSLGSGSLLSLALSLQRVSNSTVPSDPFVRVRALINDLIARLEAEATAEANQKTFCDTEMESAISARDAKALEMESLKASISKTESAIEKLEGDIAELSEEIESLRKALLEMTELRNEEKAQHNATETVAREGVETLRQALEILGQFYGGASLIQKHKYTPPGSDRDGNTVFDLAPETFDSEYSGKIAESEGIIGLLQVILSDFERTATTTAQAEAAAQAEFKKQSEAINTEITSKETALQSLETDLGTENTNLIGYKDSLNDAEIQHSNAESELQTLKASCVDAEESWEERKRHREQEIEALKDALKILREWKD